jgi:heterodisulfide reductase subunit A-like polyferredoxin
MRSHTKQFSNNIENMQQLSAYRLSENRVIVIGGGIAGLIAARVLCNHFDQVTIVERDAYPEEVVRTAPSVNSSDTSAFPPTISLTRITLSL